jgi:hypothetical protein
LELEERELLGQPFALLHHLVELVRLLLLHLGLLALLLGWDVGGERVSGERSILLNRFGQQEQLTPLGSLMNIVDVKQFCIDYIE